MTDKHWSQEQVMLFLETLQTERIIWDPNDSLHKDKKKVHDAWIRVSDIMEMQIDELKKKKESIFATYRGYCRKKEASMKNSGEGDDVYHPIWFAFDYMDSFLGFKCKPSLIKDPLSPRKARSKTKFKAKRFKIDEIPERPELPTKKRPEMNEYEIWALSCAADLKKMDPMQQIFAKKAIADILMEGQLGLLDRDSVQINCDFTPSVTYSNYTQEEYSGTSVKNDEDPFCNDNANGSD